MYSRPMLSRADVVGLTLAAGLLAVLVPVFAQELDRTAELRKRSQCAANLRGIAQSMAVYAADNNDAYPMLPLPKSNTKYDVTLKADEGAKTADDTIAAMYKSAPEVGNPTAGLWLMALTGMVAPRQFLCPSDPLANVAAVVRANNGNYYKNFQSAKNISYSSAYPWAVDKNGKIGASGAWINETDAALAVVSDMAPYLGSKGEPATRPAGSDPKAPLDANWAVKTANSQNHLFEGQNVAFGDAHAEWAKSPLVGMKPKVTEAPDSIWGIRKSAEAKAEDRTEVPIEAGVLPHPPMGASTGNDADVVMVPTRDAKGELK